MPNVTVTMHCKGLPSGFEVAIEPEQEGDPTIYRTIVPEEPQTLRLDQATIEHLGNAPEWNPRYSFDVVPA